MAEYYESNVYHWLDLALASALPFTTILICNIAMIIKLKKANKARLHMQTNQQTNGINITNLTTMLLTVSFIFLITSFPICLFLNLSALWYAQAAESEDYDAYSYLELTWVVVSLIWYMNYAINFFVYVFRGPRFWRELCAMFKRCRYCYHEEEQVSVTIATVISSDQTRL